MTAGCEFGEVCADLGGADAAAVSRAMDCASENALKGKPFPKQMARKFLRWPKRQR
jgi:hypothetical protein